MPTVLVVEDSEATRQMVEHLLRMEGYETLSAGNGQEALKVLERERPDLVLLDVMMPEMDGLTFLGRLRQLDQWRKLPVIMMTARFDAKTVGRAEELGAGDFLVKARFSAEEMLQHIREQLRPN